MKFSEIEKSEEQVKAEKLIEIEQLLERTNELNQLMQSYIRVHMKENAMTQVTIDSELEKIKRTSLEAQKKMISISKELENTQKTYAENLLRNMESGKKAMKENNQITLGEMRKIKDMLGIGMESLKKEMKMDLNELEDKTLKFIERTRRGILLNYWIDVFKYGLGTALCIVPVYIILKLLLGSLGIEDI